MSVVINGSAGVTTNSGAVYNGISAGTAVASTSGTSIDFTSIPSWVKRITVMFNGVSTNGTSNLQIQIGSGSLTTTGYFSVVQYSSTPTPVTTGFGVCNGVAAASVASGVFTIALFGSNAYVFAGTLGQVTGVGSAGYVCGGSITLGGILDRVRITTVNGTDTFDAGSINILYE